MHRPLKLRSRSIKIAGNVSSDVVILAASSELGSAPVCQQPYDAPVVVCPSLAEYDHINQRHRLCVRSAFFRLNHAGLRAGGNKVVPLASSSRERLRQRLERRRADGWLCRWQGRGKAEL